MEKSRNYSLDIIRVFACYLVIQQHAGEFYYIARDGSALADNGSWWAGVICSFGRICVPLFAMMSGFLLLPVKEEMGTFYKKRLLRIIFPFVFWCIVYAIYKVFHDQHTWPQALTNISHIPVNFGTEIGHLWYIYMLIGLYLFIPIISPWIAIVSRRNLEIYLFLWAFSLCVPYLHVIFPQLMGECYWNKTTLYYYFSGFLGYLILAVYFRKYFAAQETWHLILGIFLVLAGYTITAGGYLSALGTKSCIELELTWGFETINVAMMTAGVFLIFKNFTLSNPSSWASKLLIDISILSFGIYLAHIILLNFYFQVFDGLIDAYFIKIPVIAFFTLISSYAVVKLISYIPKSRYLIG